MYGCESWTIKEAENQNIDAFELWSWRRLLGVPWTKRRSKQSIQKEISPEYSLEELMLKLKLQYLATLCEELTPRKNLDGKDWRQEEKRMTEDEMVEWHHWLHAHEFEQALKVGDGQGSLVCCSPCGYKGLDMTEQLKWTNAMHTNPLQIYLLFSNLIASILSMKLLHQPFNLTCFLASNFLSVL